MLYAGTYCLKKFLGPLKKNCLFGKILKKDIISRKHKIKFKQIKRTYCLKVSNLNFNKDGSSETNTHNNFNFELFILKNKNFNNTKSNYELLI